MNNFISNPYISLYRVVLFGFIYSVTPVFIFSARKNRSNSYCLHPPALIECLSTMCGRYALGIVGRNLNHNCLHDAEPV